MGCKTCADGSTFSLTQKRPPFQKKVAKPLLTQSLARAGVVGISGLCSWSITGTNMCDKPLAGEYIPFATDQRSGEGLGRRLSRPVGCHARLIQFPSDA